MVWQGTTPAPSYTRLGEAGAAAPWLQDWLLCLRLQALIPLSLEGTEVGQTKAAQALAKITITSNPEMAFPGERVSVAAAGTGLPSRGPVRAVGAARGLVWEQQWGRGCSRGSPRRVPALGRRGAEQREEGLPPSLCAVAGIRWASAPPRPPGKGSAALELKATGLVIRGGICTAGTASMALPFPGEQEVARPLVFPAKAW